MKKYLIILSGILVMLSGELRAQQPAVYTSSDILLSLKKLKTFGSVLYVAAHPDDENTRLIAWLANEKDVRTAYLSLTRGDGGQNLIGDQQGELLGLIRTQELLAARRTDGAEQFFTRAKDFGFSKNPEETFEIWNKDSVLADVVWTIRKFRPDVIITRFATDGSGGHGHHTASAILAGEAFTAAADPKRFPEQLRFVKPWQAKRLLYNSAARYWNPEADMSSLISQEVGTYNALLGKSYGEIASQSRSQHKSQGFGTAMERGSIMEYFLPLAGSKPQEDIFEDLDFSSNAVEGAERFKQWINKAQDEFLADEPATVVPYLLNAYKLLDQIQDPIWKERKREDLKKVIIACAGLHLEAISPAFAVVPGEALKVNVAAINRTEVPMILERVILPNGANSAPAVRLEKGTFYREEKSFNLDESAIYTTPYWLRQKQEREGLYNVKDQLMVGLPEADAPIQVQFVLNFGGIRLIVNRPVVYKWVDPVDGELYRPLEITPPVMVNLEAKSYLFPDKNMRKIAVRVKAGKADLSGSLKLDLPADWQSVPANQNFQLKEQGEEQYLYFEVTPPAHHTETVLMKAIATVQAKTYSKGETVINFKHIPIQTLYPEAEAKMVRFELKRNFQSIGYIAGAGDDVPAALKSLGYQVTMLDDATLSKTNDLSNYEAIVVGVRAYNTNERMAIYQPKLMKYVQQGGNLVVQYNTNNRLGPLNVHIGPYPFEVSRNRVTDEHAEVRFDLPNHPLLNAPNKLSAADFNNWIQERGIYFAEKWDPKYEAPMSMNDPNEASSAGNTITVTYGKGHYVYTGLSFFRELPAGVPGAYRLFINMIEMGSKQRHKSKNR